MDKREHCKEGRDDNPDFVADNTRRSRRTSSGSSAIKMMLHHQGSDAAAIPTCPSRALRRKCCGHNAIAAGFQGQRQWTDHWPNCDYPEAILNSSFDFGTARRSLSSSPPRTTCSTVWVCCSCKLLTNRAQIFADVRTYLVARGHQARYRLRIRRAVPRRTAALSTC